MTTERIQRIDLSEPVVREATEADLPGILNVYAAAGLDDDAAGSLDDARATFERMRRYPDYRVYVAELDDRIVGTYALLVMDNLAHRGARSGIVEDVGVVPDVQGQGIGTQMMRHALEMCARAGCYKLVLSSNLNRTAAHAFYEALGFERHGYSFVVAIPRDR